MKRLVFFGTLALALALFAENAAPTARKKISPEELKARIAAAHRKFGGFIEQPGSRQGSIGFLNAQKRIPISEMEKVIATMKQMMKHDMVAKDVEAPKGLPTRADVQKAGVSVAIFAVDDPALPALLSAPEDRWALVNVAKIGEGLKDDAVGKGLLKGRFRGELQRAFSLACGGWASEHQGNLSVAVDYKGIDSLNPDALMGDVVPRYMNYLNTIKVTPARIVMYSRACQEGWAPAPTNDIQKAVWDKVHALPTKPITIEPEKAKK